VAWMTKRLLIGMVARRRPYIFARFARFPQTRQCRINRPQL
jgi:hypothetical protein